MTGDLRSSLKLPYLTDRRLQIHPQANQLSSPFHPGVPRETPGMPSSSRTPSAENKRGKQKLLGRSKLKAAQLASARRLCAATPSMAADTNPLKAARRFICPHCNAAYCSSSHTQTDCSFRRSGHLSRHKRSRMGVDGGLADGRYQRETVSVSAL